MDSVLWSRLLTTETLAFHIIWATIGVGIPIFISLAEGWGILKKDNHYILMARRWTRGFVITVAVGVVTGTCIGVLLSLLWPQFMQIAGNVISLPLFMETFAFFFEAIFLGIYLYTWDRFKKPIYHWLTSIPIIIGSTCSAVFITMVNAFMNTPTGFTIDKATKKFISIDPIAAMFNPATPTKVAHVVSSAYLTSGLLLAAIAAYHILKGKDHVYYKKALKLTMVGALVLSITTVIAGDFSAKFLAKHQPIKLAAMEWHFDTEKQAPLIVGGILDEKTQRVKYALKIPYGLSFLSHNDINKEVIGLNEFPKDEWPPLFIHYTFDLKIMIAAYLTSISFIFFLLWRIKKLNEWNPWMMRGILLAAPLAFIAIELGWITAEVGRQPWILVGLMKVKHAATSSTQVGLIFAMFSLLYLALGIIATTVLYRLFKNKGAEKELIERKWELPEGGKLS